MLHYFSNFVATEYTDAYLSLSIVNY